MRRPKVKQSHATGRKPNTLQAKRRHYNEKRTTKPSTEHRVVRSPDDESLIIVRAPEYPLPTKKIRAVLKVPFDWTVETREADIDRILYIDGA